MIDLNAALGDAFEGVFHLRNGELGHTSMVRNSDGTFSLRYESGWYCEYLKDGTRICAGIIRNSDGTEEIIPGGDERDILKFQPLGWDEAIRMYPNLTNGFSP